MWPQFGNYVEIKSPGRSLLYFGVYFKSLVPNFVRMDQVKGLEILKCLIINLTFSYKFYGYLDDGHRANILHIL